MGMKKKMYQPESAGTGDSCFSFEVYASKERAQADYPNENILEYEEGDIENPAYVDEDNAPYYVDIPTIGIVTAETDDEKAWLNVGTFHTRQSAIDFCKEHFLADDEGKISLITH